LNFLAHFHLAWPDAGMIAGGLEGDYYKGPLGEELPAALARGIRLHRAIDAYTDNHPLIAQLRRDFPRDLRRYAGILIDLSFDHYLSHHWDNYTDISLIEFNRNIYRILQDQEQELSAGSRQMLARLLEYDILGRYRDWDTVPAAALRIGERFRRHNPFTRVDRELDPARDMLERVFLAFYPELQAFSTKQQELLNQNTPALSNIALDSKSQ
jgi:acyl carrier protein phosphodiesterase